LQGDFELDADGVVDCSGNLKAFCTHAGSHPGEACGEFHEPGDVGQCGRPFALAPFAQRFG
jgi:hypothetical protein